MFLEVLKNVVRIDVLTFYSTANPNGSQVVHGFLLSHNLT